LSNDIAAVNQSIVDLSQLNLEEMVREMREEEVTKILKIIMENNTKILELQSMLVMLMKNKEKTRKRTMKGDKKERI